MPWHGSELAYYYYYYYSLFLPTTFTLWVQHTYTHFNFRLSIFYFSDCVKETRNKKHISLNFHTSSSFFFQAYTGIYNLQYSSFIKLIYEQFKVGNVPLLFDEGKKMFPVSNELPITSFCIHSFLVAGLDRISMVLCLLRSFLEFLNPTEIKIHTNFFFVWVLYKYYSWDADVWSRMKQG